jgi:hypothetical protein
MGLGAGVLPHPPPNLGSGKLTPTSVANPLAQLELVVVRVHAMGCCSASSSAPRQPLPSPRLLPIPFLLGRASTRGGTTE